MSKVQSPKSASETASSIREGQDLQEKTDRGKSTGAGPWTLDVGLFEVTDLRKTFSSPAGEKIDVLRGLSFSARGGEAIAIMGASGAGKSTLLHVLGGLEAADHGSITLDKFEVDRAQPHKLARFRSKHVGFVFQFHHLLADFTAEENVAMPLLIRRTAHAEALKHARQALEDVGLGDRSAHPVGHLSGGEQQRVATCRALITRPSLVLADEPTGNLDSSFAEELAELLVSYSRRHQAIVIVATHSQRMAQFCDRIMILSEGRLSPA